MSNRILVEYEEESGDFAQDEWILEVQRSAAGRPGLVFIIRQEFIEPRYSHLSREMTVFVSDGHAVIDPIVDWLRGADGEAKIGPGERRARRLLGIGGNNE